MKKVLLNTLLLITFSLNNEIIAQKTSQEVELMCMVEANAINKKIKDLNAEYKQIESDLAKGLFCSKCGLSKTELDKAEGFNVHLNNVQGVAVSANQSQRKQGYDRYIGKYNSLKDQLDNNARNCQTNYNNAVGSENRKRMEDAEKERQQAMELQKAQQRQQENKNTSTSSSTNNKPLTPQEIRQQQQFSQQAEQQRQIYEQNIKLQQQNEIQRQQQLAEQQRKLQEQQQRQAIIDQYNEAQMQKSIRDIQNTPINTFEVGKLEIKNVKKQPAGTGVDKGSVSSISGLDKIEVEFEEFTKPNPGSNPDIFTDPKPALPSFNVMETLKFHINMIHPLVGGIMKVELTIGINGKVSNVSAVSSPENKDLELKLSSQILKHPNYYFKPAYKNSDPISGGKLSYSIEYLSSADQDKESDRERIAKYQADEKRKRGTVILDNGQDYELKDNEVLIETKNFTPLSSFSKEVILAKINELKNLPGDTYKKIKGFFDLEFLNNADLTNENNNIKDTPTPSYSSDRLTMVNGVLHSVRRVNNKMSILTPIEK